MPYRGAAQPEEPDQIGSSAGRLRSLRSDSVPIRAGRISMTAPQADTLTPVSVFPQPVLRWRVVPPPPSQEAERLAAALNLPLPLARLLIQRGHVTEDAARRFLRPSLGELSDPQALAGMAAAVEAIVAAV